MPKKKEKSDKEMHRMDLKLNEMYGYGEDMRHALNIVSSHYANMAVVNVGSRDVHIDFLETPGYLVEGEYQFDAVRVFLPHVAAKAMAELLLKLLKTSQESGSMEILDIPEKKGKK